MIEVTQRERDQLGALLERHKIEALIAMHKPQTFEVEFDVQWLDRNALAASYPTDQMPFD
jgi:hypothetical protein